MADKILLVLAFIDDQPVAGALNFIGGDCSMAAIGAVVDKPFLHFELCYYQAIDAAIAWASPRRGGGSGRHKLARGYEPVRTTSAHYIPTPAFARRWPGS
jgi:predicted N-acyltransferase